MFANNQDPVIAPVVIEVLAELRKATAKFGPMRSAHEGYSIIHEELDEVWDEVKKNRYPEARAEMVQVAAMALRYLIDSSQFNDGRLVIEHQARNDKGLVESSTVQLSKPERPPADKETTIFRPGKPIIRKGCLVIGPLGRSYTVLDVLDDGGGDLRLQAIDNPAYKPWGDPDLFEMVERRKGVKDRRRDPVGNPHIRRRQFHGSDRRKN